MVFMVTIPAILFFFFFNDTATTEIYTLSLHDALPISPRRARRHRHARGPHRGLCFLPRGRGLATFDLHGDAAPAGQVSVGGAAPAGQVRRLSRDESAGSTGDAAGLSPRVDAAGGDRLSRLS